MHASIGTGVSAPNARPWMRSTVARSDLLVCCSRANHEFSHCDRERSPVGLISSSSSFLHSKKRALSINSRVHATIHVPACIRQRQKRSIVQVAVSSPHSVPRRAELLKSHHHAHSWDPGNTRRGLMLESQA